MRQNNYAAARPGDIRIAVHATLLILASLPIGAPVTVRPANSAKDPAAAECPLRHPRFCPPAIREGLEGAARQGVNMTSLQRVCRHADGSVVATFPPAAAAAGRPAEERWTAVGTSSKEVQTHPRSCKLAVYSQQMRVPVQPA